MDFKEFPKIARLNREVVVTEKIDGTNAQVNIVRLGASDGSIKDGERMSNGELVILRDGDIYTLQAGSRNRFVTPEADNYGFGRWAYNNARELVTGLGEGVHYGEWWGQGIQRNYGANQKRFSLFNVGRWKDAHGTNANCMYSSASQTAPACCYVVPIIANFGNLERVNEVVRILKETGSHAAPGFMKPEGVIAFHTAGSVMFKVTCEDDEKPKGLK